MSENFNEFTKDLETLKDVPCFWGKISREEAEKILEEKQVGSFLIREAENPGLDGVELVGKLEDGLETGIFSLSNLPWHHFKIDSTGHIRDFGARSITEYTDTLKRAIWFAYRFALKPVNRDQPFSLKELTRSKILGTGITEDGIKQLEIPIELKRFVAHQECHRQEIPDSIEATEHPEEIPKTQESWISKFFSRLFA